MAITNYRYPPKSQLKNFELPEQTSQMYAQHNRTRCSFPPFVSRFEILHQIKRVKIIWNSKRISYRARYDSASIYLDITTTEQYLQGKQKKRKQPTRTCNQMIKLEQHLYAPHQLQKSGYVRTSIVTNPLVQHELLQACFVAPSGY